MASDYVSLLFYFMYMGKRVLGIFTLSILAISLIPAHADITVTAPTNYALKVKTSSGTTLFLIDQNGNVVSPTMSGTIAGTYTLAGTPTLNAALSFGASGSLSSPVLSGTSTGTYTIGGTPTLGANLAVGTDNTYSIGTKAIRLQNEFATTNNATTTYFNTIGASTGSTITVTGSPTIAGTYTLAGTPTLGAILNAGSFRITSLGTPISATDAAIANRLGLLGSMVTSPCGDQQSMKYQTSNSTWVCNTSTGITSLNGNTAAAQTIAVQSGNLTILDSGATHTIGFGANPVITGGSAQTITKALTLNSLTLGGDENANGFRITALGNILPNTDITQNIGTSSGNRWNNLWASNVNGTTVDLNTIKASTGSTITISGSPTITGGYTQIIPSSSLLIRNPAASFAYTIAGSAITANRTVTIPLITGSDTLATLGLPETFTGLDVFNTLSDSSFIVNNADSTKKLALGGLSGFSTGHTNTITVPNLNGTLAYLDNTQTFTGSKTMNGLILGGIMNANSQVIQNGLVDTSNKIVDSLDTTKKVGLVVSSSTGHTDTITIPNANDTLVTLSSAQTLSSKTLSSPIISGTIGGTYTVGGTPTLGVNLALDLDNSRSVGTKAVRLANEFATTNNGTTTFFNTIGASTGSVISFTGSPTISGTYTLAGIPTLNAALAFGASGSLSSPVLSGTETGSYTIGGTPTLGANLGVSADNTWSIATKAVRLANVFAAGQINGTTVNANTLGASTGSKISPPSDISTDLGTSSIRWNNIFGSVINSTTANHNTIAPSTGSSTTLGTASTNIFKLFGGSQLQSSSATPVCFEVVNTALTCGSLGGLVLPVKTTTGAPTDAQCGNVDGSLCFNTADTKIYCRNTTWGNCVPAGAGTGNVTGAGVAGQNAYWNTASDIRGSADLIWDNTNKVLKGGTDITTSLGTKALRMLNIFGSVINGTTVRMDTIGGSTGNTITPNADNTVALGTKALRMLNVFGSVGNFTTGYDNTIGASTGSTVNFLNTNDFYSSGIVIRNPAASFATTIANSAITANRTLTIPLITGADTLATLGLGEAFTGADSFLAGTSFTLQDPTTTTKQLQFSLSGATASTILTLADTQTTSQTLTIPNLSGADTLDTLGLAQSITGQKTFTNPLILGGGTIKSSSATPVGFEVVNTALTVGSLGTIVLPQKNGNFTTDAQSGNIVGAIGYNAKPQELQCRDTNIWIACGQQMARAYGFVTASSAATIAAFGDGLLGSIAIGSVSPTNGNDADGRAMLVSPSAAGATGKITTGSFTVTRLGYDPVLTMRVKNSEYANSENLWFGFTTAVFPNSATLASAHMAVRAVQGTDTNWKISTSDGTTQTVTDTGTAVGTATVHTFRLRVDSATPQVCLSIDYGAETCKKTNLPASTTDLGVEVALVDSTAVAKNLRIYWTSLEQNG